MYRFISFILMALILESCAGSASREVTTQWLGPANCKIRIIDNDGILFEGRLPSLVNMKYRSRFINYFIEILTPQKQKIYGTMRLDKPTALTELSNVKVEITEALIAKVLDNQVSQITITDPSENRDILIVALGNKMPENMKKIYNDKKIAIY